MPACRPVGKQPRYASTTLKNLHRTARGQRAWAPTGRRAESRSLTTRSSDLVRQQNEESIPAPLATSSPSRQSLQSAHNTRTCLSIGVSSMMIQMKTWVTLPQNGRKLIVLKSSNDLLRGAIRTIKASRKSASTIIFIERTPDSRIKRRVVCPHWRVSNELRHSCGHIQPSRSTQNLFLANPMKVSILEMTTITRRLKVSTVPVNDLTSIHQHHGNLTGRRSISIGGLKIDRNKRTCFEILS